MTEEAFLAALRERPDDDATRLIFADWLEERGDEESRLKAEYIRVDCKVAARPRRSPHPGLDRQRRALAEKLPSRWLAVVTKAPIELCKFRFECPRKWEQLAPLPGSTTERFCWQCERYVTYCDDLEVARALAGVGACVAIDARLVRRSNDLAVPRLAEEDLVLGELEDT